MKDSFIILLVFVIGLILSVSGIFPKEIDLSDISKLILYLLTFSVGVNLGLDKTLFKTLKSQPIRMLLLPVSTMLGTFAGAFLAYFTISILTKSGHIASLGLLDTLSISAGFGYYSLSSILLNEARGVEIGTMALAANIIRELSTVVFAPIMVKYFGKLAPISSGGATSMDSTLPIIQNVTGNEYVPISIFHGVIMDFSVPLFLTLFVSLQY